MSLKTGSVKAKVTYREGRKLRAHPNSGVRRASPKLLENSRRLQDDGLAEIVVSWGMRFARLDAKASDASIKKTLLRLPSETDADALTAVRNAEEATRSALQGAAFRAAKQGGEKFSHTSWRTWTPEQIREYAAAASVRLQTSKGGRPPKEGLELLFAKDLIDYWIRSTGKPATVTRPGDGRYRPYKASPFLAWATAAFMAAGVALAPQSLAEILWRAKRN